MGSKALKILAPIAGAAIGSVIPGVGTAIGASVGSAAGTKLSGGSWGNALKSGLFSYGGSQIGGALGSSGIGKSLGLGGTLGEAAGFTGNAVSQADTLGMGFGDLIGKTAGNVIGGASLGSTLGGYVGNSLADSGPKMATPEQPAGFVPKQQDQQDIPSSLSAFGALSPEQQSSNIATQGVYGGGAGPDEQSYFMNLINRRLVDQAGNVDQNMSDINPIENSYLSQLGLGGYGDSKSLLEAMSKWKSM